MHSSIEPTVAGGITASHLTPLGTAAAPPLPRKSRRGLIVGLVAGIFLLIPLRRLGRAVRIYLALLFVLAGALFSKIVGAYSALDVWLKLFRWPHGQLASFATLTQFLHEAWPFLALVFLIALFLHTRRHPVAA